MKLIRSKLNPHVSRRNAATITFVVCLLIASALFALVIPSDKYFSNQWMLHNTGQSLPDGNTGVVDSDLPQAWEFTTGIPSVVTAIIDQEFMQTHPDLAPNLWVNPGEGATPDGIDNDGNLKVDDIHGWDFIDGDGDTSFESIPGTAPQNHGTLSAGVVVAARNDDPYNGGVVGIAYDSHLMTLRAVSGGEVRAALKYVLSKQPRVLSLAFAAPSGLCGVMSDLEHIAETDNTVIVIAAGNGGDDNPPTYNDVAFLTNPAWDDLDKVRIPVGSICYDGERVETSSYVSTATIPSPCGGSVAPQPLSVIAPSNSRDGEGCSPGTAPRWTDNELSTGEYWTSEFGGTSAATPHVAGVAALLFSDDPSLKASEVKHIIEQSAIDITSDPAAPGQDLTGWDKYTGYGAVNAHRALLFPWIYAPAPTSELWGGDEITIQWRTPATNTNLVRSSIYYSVDGGAFIAIAEDLSGLDSPAEYPWTVPYGIDSDNVLFKVVSYNEHYSNPSEPRNFVSDVTDPITIRDPYHGTISSNTTWSGVVALDGDVLVAQGATLTVDAGTEIIMGLEDAADLEPFFTEQVELHVRGHLDVNGTSGSPVVIRSRSNAPTESDWAQIQVISSGSMDLEYAQVRHCEWGINCATTSGVLIDNCTLDSNANADVRVFGTPSSMVVSDCHFTVGGGLGAEIHGGSVVLSGCTFVGSAASTAGIKVLSGASATIDDNTISGFSTNYGIWLSDGSTTVTDNQISTCAKGIYINKGPHTIGTSGAGNIITNNGAGILVRCNGPGTCPGVCSSLAPVVRHNIISDNSSGVVSEKTASVDLGTSGDYGYNTIIDNSSFCVWNRASTCGAIPAVGNYWGGACLIPDCFQGAVDVTEPLCSQPQNVAAMEPPEPAVSVERTHLISLSPNPFNPTTVVHFELAEAADVTLFVYNVRGQLVRSADLGRQSPGRQSWTWEGRDSRGHTVSSGVYYVVLQAGSTVDTRKAVLLK